MNEIRSGLRSDVFEESYTEKVNRLKATPAVVRAAKFRAELEAVSLGMTSRISLPIEGTDEVYEAELPREQVQRLLPQADAHLLAVCEHDADATQFLFRQAATELFSSTESLEDTFTTNGLFKIDF